MLGRSAGFGLLVAALVAAGSMPTLAGSDRFVAGASWRADLSDGRVEVRSLGAAPDGGAVLNIGLRVCSYDLVLTATTETGEFEVSTDNAAPGSTDSTEGSITVNGALQGDDLEGTVAVDVRTYDNAGDTGSCELDDEYAAEPGTRARSYERVAVVAVLDADELAGTDDAAYAVESSGLIVRIGGDGNREWEVESSDTVLALAASDEAAWVVRTGEVERLDAATGVSTGTLPLPGVAGPTEAAVGDDGSLWVSNGAAQQVFRVSADGASVLTTADVQGRPGAIAVVGQEAVVAVQETPADGGRSVERLERLEAGGEVGTQIVVDDVADLAVTGDVLWVRGLTGPAEARDLDTLELIDPPRAGQGRRADRRGR